NDNANVFSGSPDVATTATTSSSVGPSPILPGQGTLSASNYSFSFVNGTLTITKAVLTVKADNKSRAYGAANPVFTATYTGFAYGSANPTLTVTYIGFVNGDTPSVLSGSPSLSTTATSSSVPGTYPITVTVSSLKATNYSFTFVNATMTVTKAILTVKADDKT